MALESFRQFCQLNPSAVNPIKKKRTNILLYGCKIEKKKERFQNNLVVNEQTQIIQAVDTFGRLKVPIIFFTPAYREQESGVSI